MTNKGIYTAYSKLSNANQQWLNGLNLPANSSVSKALTQIATIYASLSNMYMASDKSAASISGDYDKDVESVKKTSSEIFSCRDKFWTVKILIGILLLCSAVVDLGQFLDAFNDAFEANFNRYKAEASALQPQISKIRLSFNSGSATFYTFPPFPSLPNLDSTS